VRARLVSSLGWRRLLSRRNSLIFLAYQIPGCQDARVFDVSA
jgi:hypothetical protein